MRLLVFGATGGCGSWLVSLAVARGHEVTAVVRPGSAWTAPDGARVVRGDPASEAFVREVVPGHGAVASCLGLRRASVLPWSRLLSPPDLVRTFVGHLARAVEAVDVHQIAWISAGGVGDSVDRLAPAVRRMIRAGNVGVAYADLEAAERRVPGDDPRWTVVRPVTLRKGRPTGRAGPVDRYGLLSTVRRSDVAAWMLDAVDGTRPCEGRTVLLGTAP